MTEPSLYTMAVEFEDIQPRTVPLFISFRASRLMVEYTWEELSSTTVSLREIHLLKAGRVLDTYNGRWTSQRHADFLHHQTPNFPKPYVVEQR